MCSTDKLFKNMANGDASSNQEEFRKALNSLDKKFGDQKEEKVLQPKPRFGEINQGFEFVFNAPFELEKVKVIETEPSRKNKNEQTIEDKDTQTEQTLNTQRKSEIVVKPDITEEMLKNYRGYHYNNIHQEVNRLLYLDELNGKFSSRSSSENKDTQTQQTLNTQPKSEIVVKPDIKEEMFTNYRRYHHNNIKEELDKLLYLDEMENFFHVSFCSK